MSSAIVLTGMAALTPLGDTIAAVTEALRSGRDAIRPSAEVSDVGESRIDDFEPTRYANVRGMRVYPRTTQLAICAAQRALDDAGLLPGQIEPEHLGVIMAATHTHLDTLLAYDEGLMTVGVQRTNPTLMPLGLPSAPCSAVALSLGAKALSMTINDGGAAALAAIARAAELIAADRARVCIVVAAASPCRELMASAKAAKLTASSEDFRTLDEHSCGFVFGEAAAAIVLESAEHARARGAQARAFVTSHASAFAAEGSDVARALEHAIAAALREGGVDAEQLALVSSSANGSPDSDAAEASAVLAALGRSAARRPLLAIKANFGETFDVAGLLQTIAGVEALRSKIAPVIARLRHPKPPGLLCLTECGPVNGSHALMTALSFGGSCSALVLEHGGEQES